MTFRQTGNNKHKTGNPSLPQLIKAESSIQMETLKGEFLRKFKTIKIGTKLQKINIFERDKRNHEVKKKEYAKYSKKRIM